jgi:hypothetical protein
MPADIEYSSHQSMLSDMLGSLFVLPALQPLHVCFRPALGPNCSLNPLKTEEKRREEKRREEKRRKWGGSERHYIWGGGGGVRNYIHGF